MGMSRGCWTLCSLINEVANLIFLLQQLGCEKPFVPENIIV